MHIQEKLVLVLQQRRIERPLPFVYSVVESRIENVISLLENYTSSFITNNEIKLRNISEEEALLISTTQEISEKSLLRTFSKNFKTIDAIYKSLDNDSPISEYVNSYIDRRISRCIAIAAKANIPLYYCQKNSPNLYPQDRLNILPSKAISLISFSLLPNELRYTIDLENAGKHIEISINNSEIISNQPCIIRNKRDIIQIEDIDGKKITPFTKKKYITIPQGSIKKYMESFVLKMVKDNKVEASGFNIIEMEKKGGAALLLEDRLMGGKCLVLNLIYNGKRYPCNLPNRAEVTIHEENGSYIFIKSTRNSQWEKRTISDITEKVGLKKIGEAEFLPNHIDTANTDNELDIVSWINANHKLLAEQNIEVIITDRKKTYYLEGVEINISAETEDDWFDLHGKVKLGEFEFPFINLKRYILHNIREYVLPNGQIFVLPLAWFSTYRNIFQFSRDGIDSLKLPKALINLIIDKHIDSSSASKLESDIRSISKQKIRLPQNLNAKLRDYQKIGYAWLSLISRNGINGCLADDMGLGKTLQTIALLQANKENGDNGTTLIVVPTSLIHNWENEINRFAPDLKTIIYTGLQRATLLNQILSYDIAITSYGLLRNDIEQLRNIEFNYLILDESQTIRNPASKIYRAVILLNAKHFLSLSGTPIENSLIDLWSQMNFLNRGMLGSLRNFRNEFQIPIEKNNDSNKKLQLKRLIEPLIMRRTKEEVASDLPPITEQIVQCEMTEEQAEVYEKEKSAIRHEIMNTIETEGIEKSAIHILSGLTRLRQIANHPALLPEYLKLDSGKFEEIVRCLTNIIDEGHKILVFSSFVRHLEQIKEFIETQEIGFEILTGTSTNRSEIVERFQFDTSKKVLLISLKAGGVGLNLTAADYVFILDPWWNPAAEMQAAARAHRIGQNKNVFVYRFISKNTVEEKIISLQGRKEKLAQLFVEQSNPLKYMDKDLLMDLLE